MASGIKNGKDLKLTSPVPITVRLMFKKIALILVLNLHVENHRLSP